MDPQVRKALEQFLGQSSSLPLTSPFELYCYTKNGQGSSTGGTSSVALIQEEWKKLARGKKKEYEEIFKLITGRGPSKSKNSQAMPPVAEKNDKRRKKNQPGRINTSDEVILQTNNSICMLGVESASPLVQAKEARTLRLELERHLTLSSRMGSFDTSYLSGYPTMKTPVLHLTRL